MTKFVGFCEDNNECKQLSAALRNVAAYLDIEEWTAKLMVTVGELCECIEQREGIDAAAINVIPAGAIKAAQKLRAQHTEAALMIIADETVSPLVYLNPKVIASSLLLKPYTKQQAQDTIIEMMAELVLKNADDGVFMFETKQGKTFVSYADIKCFEAKERKISLYTDTKELRFYDTLEKISTKLPDFFIRCHKGYILNSRRIQRIDFSQNEVILPGEMRVPISRSYRSTLRDWRPNNGL